MKLVLHGYKKMKRKLRRIKYAAKSTKMHEAVEDTLNHTSEIANKVLKSKMEGTRTHGDMSKRSSSGEQSPIMESWETEMQYRGGTIKAILKNNSGHAAAVEFGVHHSIFPKTGDMLYLGRGIGWRPFVTGFTPGYHYLGEATSGPQLYEIKNKLAESVRERLPYL